MAKGGKLMTTSRSERYLRSDSYNHTHGTSVTDQSELGEVDVWSRIDRDGYSPINSTWSSRAVSGSNNVMMQRGQQMSTSAPVNIPDWSKILPSKSNESMYEYEDYHLDEREPEMVPPHEYLAREYSRTGKVAATSVFEGVGRTLKGRDLRRLRDSVWTQTGFAG